ncbi:PspC domain-containing protein [Cloacibacterium normanense]|uniref:PspC domain-containing protein n=1 Tax=Cloacibacterium normanense TaxID=237258 RepID=UPI003919FFBE
MNKTLSIGLAGFSFVIEEHAYIKLSDYLAALRSSLEESEADEIMHDIEIRIVEILKDNMGKREVVNDDDIEKVIAQIGKPEVIEEQEEAYFSDKTANKKSRPSFSSAQQKQLFRDPENMKLAGVCSGLAAYFGMDVTWMRVIWTATFLIMIPAAGSALIILLLYAVLWLVLPKAETAADFLKMKGKPLNFDNLKEESSNIVKFANESTAKVGEMYNEAKPVVTSAGNGLWNAFRFIFGVLFAAFALFSIFGLLFVFGLFGNPDFPGVSKMNFLFDDGGMKYVLSAIVILGTLIPAVLFSLLSIKLLSPKTKLKNLGYLLAAIIAALLLLGTYFGINMAKKDMIFKGDKEETENISINVQPTDSLIIDKKQVNIPSNYTAYDDDIFSDKKMVFEEDYPNVEVVRNANITQPYLIIKKYAEGYNKPLELNVPVEVVGNKILLPNFVSYPYQYRFRHYSVDYELVVPKEMKVAKGNEHLNVNGDLNANGIDDDDENNNNENGDIVIEKNKININGTTIEYDSENADSVIINGKKYPKKVADSILEKDIKNIKSLKDLENLKDLNISIKDGDSKIEINTKK